MKRAIPYNNVLWVVMAIGFLLAGAALCWGGWWAYENHLFADHAQRVQGKVLRTFLTESHARHGGSNETRHMAYAYQAGNLEANGETVVHGDTWSKFGVGAPIPIKYLPEDPQVSRIDDWAEDFSAATKAWAGVGGGLLGFVLLTIVSVSTSKMNRRQKRLVARGLSCLGRVTSVETERAGKRQMMYLKFEFTDNRGRVVEGRTWHLSPKQAGLWETGKPVKVFFDPADPDVFTVDLDQSRYQK